MRRAQAGLDKGGAKGEDEQGQDKEQRWPEDAEGREHGQAGGGQVPFGHQRERPERGRRRLIERLEQSCSPDAMIDAGLAPPERARQTAAVH